MAKSKLIAKIEVNPKEIEEIKELIKDISILVNEGIEYMEEIDSLCSYLPEIESLSREYKDKLKEFKYKYG